ncbi:CD248 molecule, endosialin a [Conger conger]|uniref:CD248 molecule, endosialin a n=1 Tax=Conger conger TaxID=82655 RepID=UPI002A5A1985|nr:CD248 molecule, endosialin a [Conger conger]
MGSVVLLCVLLSALHALWTPGVRSQSLPERNGLCGEDGCFVVYFQRKTFLEAWRSCKEKGGNLATMKLPAEARQVEELLAGAVRRGSRAKVRVWIGLQRQPRQCSATRPLRGFSWTTGDQDTQYTNWLREDSPSTCSAPRCVVTTHSTANHEARDNYKWLDGSCSLPVDGFLCRFVYEKGMCQPIPGEGGPGPVMYNTPFQLLSARLTHIPFGSMATVPCPDGPMGDQSVLCVAKEDGMAGWHQDGPFCTEPSSKSWCQEDNGGCEHLCVEANDHYYCECPPEFRLAEDRHSCIPLNPCRDAPCEHDCVQLTEGYRCTCRGGFQLAPDGIGCVDEDECLDSPCEQACENRHGSYTCHCHLGFFPLPEDPARCQDVDECQFEESCEQMCVNYIGGFQCHCREGYELQPDYSSCRAVPDTDKSPTAAPSFSWVTDLPENSWFPQLPEGHWPSETIPREWLTDRPHLEGLPTDLTGPTDVPAEQEREPVNVEEPGEGVRTEDRDRADEHDRWEQPYRPEEEGREDENDRQQKPYRPEVEDTEEEHYRPQEPYRPEEEDRVDENDRQQKPYRPEEEDREDGHDRPQEPYRPEEEDRMDENDRQQKPYRPEVEDTEEEHYRPQEPYRPEDEDRMDENDRQQKPYRPEVEDTEEEHYRPQEPYRPEEEDRVDENDRQQPYRPEVEDTEEEHYRPQEPYRPEEEDRVDENDRQQPYRPEVEDTEEEHYRPQEPYRPEEEDRVDENDRQQPYRPEVEDTEEEHYRPQEPYRPEEEDRVDENDRQQPYKPELEDTEEKHYRPLEPYRPEEEDGADGHDRPQEHNRPEEQEREDDNDRQTVHILQEKEVQHELEGPDGSDDKGAQSWAPLDQLALTTSPSATSTPDSYEYSEEGIDQLETPPPLPEEAEPSWDPTSSPQTDGVVISDEGYGDGDGDKDGDEAGPDPHTPEPSTEGPPESGSNKQQGNRWLLIALLVPLCIFLVVMVVLGIVYCTRCSARARSKNNKDCYHWISGANDKAGSPGAAKV